MRDMTPMSVRHNLFLYVTNLVQLALVTRLNCMRDMTRPHVQDASFLCVMNPVQLAPVTCLKYMCDMTRLYAQYDFLCLCGMTHSYASRILCNVHS